MKKIEYIKMYDLEKSHFWFLGKTYFINTALNNHKSKIKSILDIGSGTGGMTEHLESFGKVLGLEKNSTALKLSKKRGLKIIYGDANKIRLGRKRFDLVTLFDVLYHKDIKDEKNVLKSIRKILKPKGLILITDSAFDFLKSGHDIEVEGKRRYSLDQITSIVKSSGFKILRGSYIYFSLFPFVLIKRGLIDKITQSKKSDVDRVPVLINYFFKNLIKLESIMFKYLSFPFGVSVLILAQKKK